MLGAFKTQRTYSSRRPHWRKCPIEDHPLAFPREPSALEGWIKEILYCDPKGSRAFPRTLSTEGRDVRLC